MNIQIFFTKLDVFFFFLQDIRWKTNWFSAKTFASYPWTSPPTYSHSNSFSITVCGRKKYDWVQSLVMTITLAVLLCVVIKTVSTHFFMNSSLYNFWWQTTLLWHFFCYTTLLWHFIWWTTLLWWFCDTTFCGISSDEQFFCDIILFWHFIWWTTIFWWFWWWTSLSCYTRRM